MLRLEKVATPADAATLVAPDSVPPPAFVPSATVTFPENPVAVLPRASRTVTCTGGASAAPAVTFVGCTVNATALAAPGVTSNGALVAVGRAAAAAVSV